VEFIIHIFITDYMKLYNHLVNADDGYVLQTSALIRIHTYINNGDDSKLLR
jgi:hypothetical protein